MLSRLRLRHFRNYTSLDIDLGKGVTLLCGGNGQGKTSILEAVHYLSVLRSFRTRKTNDLKQWGSRFFFTEGLFSKNSATPGPSRIGISYADRRRLRVDGNVVNRAVDFIGKFRCIACVPEDIMIVKGGPAERRRFVDMLLCQHSNNYLAHLSNYQTALKARNRMLKEPGRYGRSAFAAYDHVLARHAAPVIKARQIFGQTFGALLADAGSALFGGGAKVACRYSANLGADYHDTEAAISEQYGCLLKSSFERDTMRARTTAGPHLDDYTFTLDDVDVGEFGSEGQCRMMSLALKLTSVDFLHEEDRTTPLIMLVDDVLGELDKQRRQLFFDNFEKATQVIVACTEASEDLCSRACRAYSIKDGTASLVDYDPGER